MLRIIGGSKKRMKLKAPKDYDKIRPTMKLLKKAIFDLIGPEIIGADILDLYSGTGALSIEALSRGAESAVLVDKDSAAIKLINENLEISGFTDKATVIQDDIYNFVNNLTPNKSFDFIFVDPPYDNLPGEDLIIKLLDFLREDGVLFMETRAKDEVLFDDREEYILQTRFYGKTKLYIVIKR